MTTVPGTTTASCTTTASGTTTVRGTTTTVPGKTTLLRGTTTVVGDTTAVPGKTTVRSTTSSTSRGETTVPDTTHVHGRRTVGGTTTVPGTTTIRGLTSSTVRGTTTLRGTTTNQCSYCKRFEHQLYEYCCDGKVKVVCPKSNYSGRMFGNVGLFRHFVRVDSVCRDLWRLEEHLQPGYHYKIKPRSRRFFKFVRQTTLNDGGIFENFTDLLEFYHERVGPQRHYKDGKVKELCDFMDMVIQTPVMTRVYTELVRLHMVKNKKGFRQQLWDLWFKLYGPQLNRCGFKHIFCGESDSESNDANQEHEVGLHNWIRYFEQQSIGNIEYLGWAGSKAPDETANIVTINFKWMDELKERSSMFIGTSPEFEMALYTFLFFIGDEEAPNKARFGIHEVDIRIKRGIEGQQPGLIMAYPEEVFENVDGSGN